MKVDTKNIFIIFSVFLVFVIIVHWFLPFDKSNWLYKSMHVLDVEILKNSLLSGLFYLHSQPPFFNLFLGIILKIVPIETEKFFFELIYFLMHFGLASSVYFILRRLSVLPHMALLGGITTIFFPSLVMAERWLSYILPLAFLMVSALICLYFSFKKYIFFLFFLLCLFVIVGMRGFFHWIFWMLPIITIVLFFMRKKLYFRYYLLTAVLFFSLAGVPYLKNYFVFGFFGPSSWQGMNLTKTLHFVPKQEIEKLVDNGKVTAISLIEPFSAPESYYDYYHLKASSVENKAIDAFYKIGGYRNYNNNIYINASLEYQKNFIEIVKAHPAFYLKSVINETYIFFSFGSGRLFNGSWPGFIRYNNWYHSFWNLADYYLVPLLFSIIFTAILWFLIYIVIREIKSYRNNQANNVSFMVFYIFILFNILYVFFISTFLELGESNLMRIPIDPFLIITTILILDHIFKKFKLQQQSEYYVVS